MRKSVSDFNSPVTEFAPLRWAKTIGLCNGFLSAGYFCTKLCASSVVISRDVVSWPHALEKASLFQLFPSACCSDLCADLPVLPSFFGLAWPHSNVVVLGCRPHSVGPSRMCPAPCLSICPPPTLSPSCPHADNEQHSNTTFSQKLALYTPVFCLAF